VSAGQLQEHLHSAFQSPELLPAYEQFKANFGHYDTDGNGEISWEEFVTSVTTHGGKQYAVNMDLYRFMFEVGMFPAVLVL
jgi:Ca2+-binding EF-hand superfamily protein